MQKHKIGIIPLISLVFIIAMGVIRGGLWFMTPSDAAMPLPILLKVAATGLLFDLATLAYILIPIACYLLLVPRRLTASRFHIWVIRACFLLFFAALVFDACAEYLFFDEFATRFNFIAVDYLIYTNEVLGNIRESYPLTPIFIAIGSCALLTTWLMSRPLRQAATVTFGGRFRRTGALLLLPALLSLAVVNSAQSTISTNSYANELSANGIYNLVAAFRNNELSFSQFYRTAPEEQVLARLHTLVAESNNHFITPGTAHFARNIQADGPPKSLNLVVVVEESLSAEFLGSYGNNDQLTPNLDRLAAQSLRFSNLYATGTRTVRGLEALTLSIPPLPGTSIVKRPHNDGFRSWGEILKGKGYDTKYIYAGYGYFDNMNAFFSGNGFSVVDRSNFARDEITFANIWGVCDEDLFRKTIREANTSYHAGKPFFSMVMTTSNHRPYTYPEGRIDIPSKTGRKGGVKYADYAIGRLIAEASHEPWFKDTMFVIIADHCASSAGKSDLPVKKYEIPLLVYAPAHIKPGQVNQLMSQIDVAPTILGLLHQSYQTTFLGRDVFRENTVPPRAFISTYQKLGYLTEDTLLVLGPRKYAAQYHLDRQAGTVIPTTITPLKMDDMLAYYQGADYIYQHRLNRIR